MRNFCGGVLLASLAMAQGGFRGPGLYEIANLKSGKLLDLDRNDQTTVIQFAPRGTDNQRWEIVPAGQGTFFIRNAMNGKALEAPDNRNSAPLICGRFDRGANQLWRLEPGKDGNLLIISRWNKTIDVPDGASRDGLRLQIYDTNGDSNQRFILRRIGEVRFRDEDRDREPPRIFDGGRGRGDRNREPDPSGRFWDEREQMWKLAGDGVCFYRERDFRGEALCTRSGNDLGNLGRDASFASMKLFGRARQVIVFERPDYRGDPARLNRDMRDLDRIGNRIGSFRVN
jgi:hypothetical protein